MKGDFEGSSLSNQVNDDGTKEETQKRNKMKDNHVFNVTYKVCSSACEAVQRVAGIKDTKIGGSTCGGEGK
jgi:hypothetical protein